MDDSAILSNIVLIWAQSANMLIFGNNAIIVN